MSNMEKSGNQLYSGELPPDGVPHFGTDGQDNGNTNETPSGNPLTDLGQAAIPGNRGVPRNPRGNIYYMTIIGHIEGHTIMPPNVKTTKYEHVIPQLLNVAENPEIEGLLVILNTVGGDVEAGLAISELIANIDKPTVSLVLGGCHSIGVPLAVAARHSYIAPSGTMTLHPIRMNGTVIGAPQTYDYFNKMQERVDDFVISHSGIKKARLSELMLDTDNMAFDVGTVLVGEEAVGEKLINETGGLKDAMEKLYKFIDQIRRKKK